MSTFKPSPRAIGHVIREAKRALATLQRWSDIPGNGPASFVPGSISSDFVRRVTKAIRSYERSLRRIHASSEACPEKRRAQAHKLALSSFDARLVAVVCVSVRRSLPITLETALTSAKKLTAFKPLAEQVSVRWILKPNGGARLIVEDGPGREGQRLLVRNMLLALDEDEANPFDFTRKGAGGERALIKEVTQHMQKGFPWWWTPDIRNFYPSLKPGHLKGIPLRPDIRQNVAFYPKEALFRIEGVTIKKVVKLKAAIETSYPQYGELSLLKLREFTAWLVRQGLPQGSALSPLLARGFVGRQLQSSFAAESVVGLSYSDNLVIGARTKPEALQVQQDITEGLKSHPAGPLELHQSKIRHKNSRQVEILGYVLEPGNGYGGNPVHVKPGKPRTKRHHQRLRNEVARTPADESPFDAGMLYWDRWRRSHPAWTKVPGSSDNVSYAIAASIVDSAMHPPQKPLIVPNPKSAVAAMILAPLLKAKP